MAVKADQVWRRAKVRLDWGDERGTVEYARARVVLHDGVARVIDPSGALLAQDAYTSTEVDGRVTTVHLAVGGTWTVTKASGCGCGK